MCFLLPVIQKSGNRQGILIHVLGMNSVINTATFLARQPAMHHLIKNWFHVP